MQFEVQWDLKRFNIDKPIAEFRAAAGAALYMMGEKIIARAVELCPVDTGALRGSKQVYPPEFHGANITVRLGFGNASVKYAEAVHEAVGRKFRVGQAKFFEVALLESAPTFREDVRAFMAVRLAA